MATDGCQHSHCLQAPELMEVPWQDLTMDALEGLIEEFVTREGTEYGASEVSLAQKVAQIVAQLERGDVLIVYDDETGTTSILPRVM